MTKIYSLIVLTCLFFGCKKNETADFREVVPIETVKAFQDIRFKDLSAIEPQLDSTMIPTLIFNEGTVWPAKYAAFAKSILEMGKDPGLGIKSLHISGITGSNVNVGIIDQHLCTDLHPEFKNKIVEYFDTGCGQQTPESSMHGPAVLSLLAGENIGVAPGVKVYYAAAPSWTGDSKYFADGLNWIIEKNAQLPEDKKIRVVSVSAGPSGEGSPFTKNREMWDQAYKRAQDSGILVLDCTPHYGFNGPCYYDIFDRDKLFKCKPGTPDLGYQASEARMNIICTPNSRRTVAEQYDNGIYSYSYCGKAGLSWSIPYMAGVLALGWQVNPNLTIDQIKAYAFETAYLYGDIRIIDPVAFINKVKETIN